MKKDSKQRLFEVMGRLDSTFKPKLNELLGILDMQDLNVFDGVSFNYTIYHDVGAESGMGETQIMDIDRGKQISLLDERSKPIATIKIASNINVREAVVMNFAPGIGEISVDDTAKKTVHEFIDNAGSQYNVDSSTTMEIKNRFDNLID